MAVRAKTTTKTIALSSSPAATAARLFILAGFLAALLAAAMVLAGTAKAGASFDGAWRVTIINQYGNCAPAYSYPVKVEGGRVSYSGDGSFDITGHVGDAGVVRVAIARGDQKASASGRLSANSGSGQWSGKSSSTACSGHEVARNQVSWRREDGTMSSAWNGGNCGTITDWNSNTWNAPLDPATLKVSL